MWGARRKYDCALNFEILDQFSHSSFEIRGFSLFNQILLGLVDVLYAFQDCI